MTADRTYFGCSTDDEASPELFQAPAPPPVPSGGAARRRGNWMVRRTSHSIEIVRDPGSRGDIRMVWAEITHDDPTDEDINEAISRAEKRLRKFRGYVNAF